MPEGTPFKEPTIEFSYKNDELGRQWRHPYNPRSPHQDLRLQKLSLLFHQTAAILDKKEMVEIRHNLIIRRQSLRRRMDYNKEMVAGKAQAEIKDLVDKYPKYAAEIVGIVEQYAKNEKALTSLQ